MCSFIIVVAAEYHGLTVRVAATATHPGVPVTPAPTYMRHVQD